MYTPKALGVTALLLTGLALTACGSSGGSKASSDTTLSPAPAAGSDPATPGTSVSPTAGAKPATCGKIQMKGNEESVVRVTGTTPCKTLMAVINAYDKAAKQGTNGAATIKGWTCKTASPAENKKHGYITFCAKGTDAFATTLR